MEIIYKNPYRIVGVYAGVSEREYQSQKSKINAFMRAGKDLMFDQDFEFLPVIKRDSAKIEYAFSKLQLNQNKLFCAIFWFVKVNHIDETALRHLENGSQLKAREIWNKVLFNQDISSKNVTSYMNLSTLQLALALNSNMADVRIRVAFQNKYSILKSDYFYEFVHLVTDDNYNPDKDEIIKQFVDEVIALFIKHKKQFEYRNQSIYREVNEVFAGSSSVIEEYVKQKMISIPVSAIERNISTTSKKRMEKPSDGLNLSRNLIASIKEDWSEIRSNFKGDYAVQQISDKIAFEIFLCAINCFNEHVDNKQINKTVDSEKRFGNSVLSVLDDSIEYATNEATKQRIHSNIDTIKEWVKETEERVHYQKIEADMKSLEIAYKICFERPDSHFLERKAGYRANINDIYSYWQEVKPLLMSIQQTMGRNDDTVVEVISAVLHTMTNHIVRFLNGQMKLYEEINWAVIGFTARDEFPTFIYKAMSIMEDALTFTVNNKTTEYINSNLSVIRKLYNDLTSTSRTSYSRNQAAQSSGCANELRKQIQSHSHEIPMLRPPAGCANELRKQIQRHSYSRNQAAQSSGCLVAISFIALLISLTIIAGCYII